MAPGSYPRSPIIALILFTIVPVPMPSIHTALGRAEALGAADEEEPPWIDAVGRGQAGSHFPGVHKGHTEVRKAQRRGFTWRIVVVVTSLMTTRMQTQLLKSLPVR